MKKFIFSVILTCTFFIIMGCTNNYEKKVELDFVNKGIMAHACGEIDGYDYTNSKEALELSLNKGIRYVEVDFSLTSDDKIVALHPYNKDIYLQLGFDNLKEGELILHDEFMSSKLCGKYTPMDFDDVISFLKDYDDLYVLIDISKDLDVNTTEKMYTIMSEKLLRDNLTDKVVVQAGTKDMFDTIDKIYKFPYKNFYVQEKRYRNGEVDGILKYMDNHDGFISIGAHKGYTNKSFVSKAHKHGYYFGNFPINTLEEAEKFYGMGVDYVCTDLLSFEEIKQYK